MGFQPPPAHRTDQQPGQLVAADDPVFRGGDRGGQLSGEEVGLADESGMRRLLREHPLAARVPGTGGTEAGALVTGHRLVVVGTLPVPYLPTGIAWIGEDLGDRS